MSKKQTPISNDTNVLRDISISEIIEAHTFEAFLRDYMSLERLCCPRLTIQKNNISSKRNSSRRNKAKAESTEQEAYKFRGFPENKEDEILLRKTVGSCRFLWNKMKSDRDECISNGTKYTKTPASYKEEYSFLKEVDSLALCNVQLNLQSAYSDWMNGSKGKPKFKKKHLDTDTYTTNISSAGASNLRLEGNKLILPKLSKPITLILHRDIREGGILKHCTVTHEPSGEWSFSLVFEYEKREYFEKDWVSSFLEEGDITALKSIGLDMSLPYLYIDSNGNKASYTIGEHIISFEKYYRKLESHIAKEQKKLSRMVKNSKNYKKQCKRIASLHAKAKHQRWDFLHQLSCRLVREYDIISIEDIDVSAMKKSLKFGKSLSDNGWGMFRNMLYYKAEKKGTYIVTIDKWFPSSKKCSKCGYIHKELQLSDRLYVCPECGNTMDRDAQAAINIDEEGVSEFLNSLTGNLPERYKRKKQPPLYRALQNP